MNIVLNDVEVRVLGALMEKEMATPDYYPLSLNGLINACNQKSNRYPVVSYDEGTVLNALDRLMEQRLVRQSNLSRVAKYEQIFTGELHLLNREEAILSILLLRGPQTAGEIRSRTERLYTFVDLDEVENVLIILEESGVVKKLPLRPGHKECRYSHLFSGEPLENMGEKLVSSGEAVANFQRHDTGVEELQNQVNELRSEIEQLRMEFAAFRSQFE